MKDPKQATTEQEIFDFVVDHLQTQNCKALDDRTACRYRGPNGTMCAAGCLITDDEYDPQIEGKTVYSVKISRISNQLGLVRLLQCVHDNRTVEDWPDALREVALHCGLSDAAVRA